MQARHNRPEKHRRWARNGCYDVIKETQIINLRHLKAKQRTSAYKSAT